MNRSLREIGIAVPLKARPKADIRQLFSPGTRGKRPISTFSGQCPGAPGLPPVRLGRPAFHDRHFAIPNDSRLHYDCAQWRNAAAAG